jgi:hypothetical protein
VTGLGANDEDCGGEAHAEFGSGENIITAASDIADQKASPQPEVESVRRIR